MIIIKIPVVLNVYCMHRYHSHNLYTRSGKGYNWTDFILTTSKVKTLLWFATSVENRSLVSIKVLPLCPLIKPSRIFFDHKTHWVSFWAKVNSKIHSSSLFYISDYCTCILGDKYRRISIIGIIVMFSTPLGGISWNVSACIVAVIIYLFIYFYFLTCIKLLYTS